MSINQCPRYDFQNIEYASRIDSIMHSKVPDVMADGALTDSQKHAEIERIYHILTEILPNQTKYTMDDINRYFQAVGLTTGW